MKQQNRDLKKENNTHTHTHTKQMLHCNLLHCFVNSVSNTHPLVAWNYPRQYTVGNLVLIKGLKIRGYNLDPGKPKGLFNK